MDFDSFLEASSLNDAKMSGLVGYESSGGEDENGDIPSVKAAV